MMLIWVEFCGSFDFGFGGHVKLKKVYLDRRNRNCIDIGFKAKTDLTVILIGRSGNLDFGIFSDIGGTDITWDTEVR